MAKAKKTVPTPASRAKRPSSLIDTRVIYYCGDNLEQLRKLPDGCVDLIYIDPPFNSNRNYEVFWGENKEHASHYVKCIVDQTAGGTDLVSESLCGGRDTCRGFSCNL